MKLLNERGDSGHSFTTSIDREIVKDIKQKLTYVSQEYDKELILSETPSNIEEKFELPDGELLTVGSERFRCPEALFKPNLIGRECDGIDKLTYNCIKKCDIDIRDVLYRNILLTGGNTFFDGIGDRLETEISKFAPANSRVRVVSKQERKYAAWIGGSILASLSSFEETWITKDEYDESGTAIVHRKCF